MSTKIKNVLKIVLVLSILTMLAMPASAADMGKLLTPGMGSAWLDKNGVDVKETLNYVLGALMFSVFISWILFSGLASIKTMANSGSSGMGKPNEMSSGQHTIVNVFIALFLFVLFLRLGGAFFGYF